MFSGFGTPPTRGAVSGRGRGGFGRGGAITVRGKGQRFGSPSKRGLNRQNSGLSPLSRVSD